MHLDGLGLHNQFKSKSGVTLISAFCTKSMPPSCTYRYSDGVVTKKRRKLTGFAKKRFCKISPRNPPSSSPGPGNVWGRVGSCGQWGAVLAGSALDPAVIKQKFDARVIAAQIKLKANKPAAQPGRRWVWVKVGMKGRAWRSVPVAAKLAPLTVTPKPAVPLSTFTPTPTMRARAVPMKPGASAKGLVTPKIETPITPAPPMRAPVVPQKTNMLPMLAVGAAVLATLVMR